MASMLYYGLDESVIPDSEFDDMCNRVADNWKDLSKQRQVCLGSPDKIRTSGFHVRVTTLAEHGAVSWLQSLGRYDPKGDRRVVATLPQKRLKSIGHWRPTHGYMWIYE